MAKAKRRSPAMKRPAIRLRVGGGELVPPGPNPRAQWLFLEAVRRCAPETFRELAAIAQDLPVDDEKRHAPSRLARRPGADDPVREWCLRRGFTARPTPHGHRDWLLVVARRTAWYLRRKQPSWPVRWVLWTGSPDPGLEHSGPTYDPAAETEAEYRARVEQHVAAVTTAARSAGWTAPPEKRTLAHFDWTARYQVSGWTEAQIAEHYGDAAGKPDVPVVSRGITETARLIGLKLRPARGRLLSQTRRA